MRVPTDHAEPILRFDADRCIALASPVSGCGACAGVCPTEAITVAPGSFALRDEACVACGRCVAVCPSEALKAPKSLAKPSASGIVECVRVPASLRLDGAVTVTCLGALRGDELVAVDAAAGPTLVDRGWCADCPAGGCAAPWHAALVDALTMAAAFDLPRPAVVQRIASARLARPLERALGDQGASRRAFFRRVAAPSGWVEPRIRRSGSRARKVDPAAPMARARHVERLAEAAGRAVPASLFPAFRITDACRDSRICTAVCPSEALVRVEEPEAARIEFRAARCIDCGACVERCPENAIEPMAADGAYREIVTLKRTAERSCTACARRFVPRAGETVCKSCTDDRELAMAGFALQRRPRAAEPHDPARTAPENPDRGVA